MFVLSVGVSSTGESGRCSIDLDLCSEFRVFPSLLEETRIVGCVGKLARGFARPVEVWW